MTGLSARFLYAAMQIQTAFVDDMGHKKLKSGTAFFIDHPSGRGPFLVTNRHLVDVFESFPPTISQKMEYKNYKIDYIEVKGRFSGDRLQTFKSMNGKHFIVFPDNEWHDVAVIKFHSVISDEEVSVDNAFGYDTLAQIHEFGTEILACDVIAFPGYSEWVSEREMRPTFRVGWIVSDPRHGIDLPKVKGDAMLIEGFSTRGSSGAPVIVLEKGIRTGAGLTGGGFRPFRLVGINAGHFTATDYLHAHLSYLFKSTVIDECVKKLV